MSDQNVTIPKYDKIAIHFVETGLWEYDGQGSGAEFRKIFEEMNDREKEAFARKSAARLSRALNILNETLDRLNKASNRLHEASYVVIQAVEKLGIKELDLEGYSEEDDDKRE